MQVTLVAFSTARERLGWSERVVECTVEDTPRALLARVAPELPVDTMRVAVDEEYQAWDAPIGAAREVALIPPVSGG